MTAAGVTAPPAPGRLGVPLDPAAARQYLDALGSWTDARRAELDRLDAVALETGNTQVIGDITLSLALWKAIADRYALLLASWDSGRVGPTERERLAALIWGRLDAGVGAADLTHAAGAPFAGLAVSLPEACRLSDALAGSLRTRLGLDGTGLDLAERVRMLRAQLERIRDQAALEPAGAEHQAAAGEQARLAARLQELTDKAARGGDIGGLIGPLETDAARFERDLIVQAARRRQAGALVGRARALRTELEARETALRTIVARCLATVDPAPRYAVPDIDALGPMPNTTAPLQVYLQRLEQVGKAMSLAETAYLRALEGHAELSGRLEAFRAKAAATGVAEQPDLARAYALAREALDRRPARMPIAEQLVTLYRSYLDLALDRRAAGDSRKDR